MGGIYVTEKMKRHVAGCAQCKAATKLADRCDVWSDMYQNVVDFECGEGPFENKPGALMCITCDGPVVPGETCAACGTKATYYCDCPHCDDCDNEGTIDVPGVGKVCEECHTDWIAMKGAANAFAEFKRSLPLDARDKGKGWMN